MRFAFFSTGKVFFVLLILSLAIGLTLAVFTPNALAKQQEEQQEQNVTTKRISDVLTRQEGFKEIKPINLEEMGDKMLELGDRTYEMLQKSSLAFLVWGAGISVAILFLGIFLGKAAVTAGFIGIGISLLAFIIIQYMPEVATSLLDAVGSVFFR